MGSPAPFRVYPLTLVLTLVAMCAFGVFIVRDYQDQGGIHGVALSGAPGQPAAAALATPSVGGTGVAAPGAGSSSVTNTTGGTAGQAATAGRTTGGGSAATKQACQNGTIKLGAIIPITGPVTQQTAADALITYFKYKVNAQGGINGCQVDFTYLDDGGLDNQKAAADARELVQEDGVFAIVGNIEPVTTGVTEPYFAQQHVPVVGVDGVGINEYNSQVEYSFAESPDGFGISTADFAKTKGCMKLAVFYLDFDFGHESFNAMQNHINQTHSGQSIVYQNAENISSQSYRTDTLSAEQSNPKPDCVINIMDANSVTREFQAMQQNAWYPMIVGTTSTSDPVVNGQEKDWLSSPSHVVYVQRNYQPANANIPEVQEWVQMESRYFGSQFDPNSYAEGAWLAAKTFTDVATLLGSNLTRNTLLQALDTLRAYHNGFEPDISMTRDHGPNKQVMWMQWSASQDQYLPITGFQPW
jgi:branched-chain amino acid transport system substrate-binding protein